MGKITAEGRGLMANPKIMLILSLLFFVSVHASPVFAAEKNSCIECHKNLPPGTYVGHKYPDYAGSVHDRKGVRCEACHGGDPVSRDAKGAHAGMYKSGDPKSPIYYQNIPWTCGKCHERELVNFSQSKHYLELKTSGKGPSCVTCHGSMGTFILNSAQIQEFCAVCHNSDRGILPDKPAEVEEILTLMEQTDTLIRWSEEFVNTARMQGKNVAGPEEAIRHAHQEMAGARESWHTFKMEEVRARLKEAYNAARKAKEKIR